MKNILGPKERILTTAYQLFYSQGYNVTGINQILKESKVAKASLYTHFGSKEDLGIEYVKKVRTDWFLSFDNYLNDNDTAVAKILSAFDFLEKTIVVNDFKGCRFLNLLAEIDQSSPRMQLQIVQHKNKVRLFFKNTVAEVVGQNTSTSDTIYLLFEAAIIESKVYHDIWPILAAKQAVQKILNKTS